MNLHRTYSWQTIILSFAFLWVFAALTAFANPGNFSFEKFSYSASESSGALPIRILRNEGTDGEVSVDFYTLPDVGTPSSFSYQTNHIVFAEGQGEATVNVPITYDRLPDNYRFLASLTNATGGTSAQSVAVTATIQNSEPVFSFGSVKELTISEGGSNIFVTVYVQGSSGNSELDAIEVVFEGIAASSGLDYVDGSRILYRTNLTGVNKVRIPVSIVPDHLLEQDESFRIYLRPKEGFLGLVNAGESNITVIIPANGQPGTVDYATMSSSPFFTNFSYYAYGAVQLEDGDLLVSGNFEKNRTQKTSYLRLSPSFELKSDLLFTNLFFTEVRPTKDGKFLGIRVVNDFSIPDRLKYIKFERFLSNSQKDPSFSNPTIFTNFGYAIGQGKFNLFDLAELSNGTMLLKGGFDAASSKYVYGMAKLAADGSIDPSFKPFLSDAGRQPMTAIGGMVSRQDDSVWISASLPSHERSSEPYQLHRISPWGYVDADFHPDWSGRLETLTSIPDGRVLGLGTVTNSDGMTWTNPILDAKGLILSSASWLTNSGSIAAVQADTKLLIIGSNSVLRRFNLDGTVDPSFTPFAPKSFNLPSIVAALILPNNQILVFSYASGAVPLKQITYLLYNDPIPAYCTLAPFDSIVKENSGSLKLRVVRQGGAQGIATAIIRSTITEGQNNDRVHAANLTVEFADGEVNPKEINIPIQDNAILDGDLKLQLAVTTTGNSNAPSSMRSVTIHDNEYGSPNPQFAPITDVLASAVQDDGRVVYATSSGVIRRDRDGKPSQNFSVFLKSLAAPCVLVFDEEGNLYLAAIVENRNRIFKIAPNGTVFESFSVEADNTIHCLLPTPNGGLIIGGAFQHVQGQPRTALAKIFTSDGTLDSRFYCMLKMDSVVNDLQSSHDYDESYFAGGSLLWDGGYDKPVPHGLARIGLSGDVSSVQAVDSTTIYQVLVQRNNQILALGRSELESPNNAFQTNSLIRLNQVASKYGGTTEGIDDSFQSPFGLQRTPKPGERMAAQLSDNSIFILTTNSSGTDTSMMLAMVDGFGRINESFLRSEIQGLPILTKAGDIAVHAGGYQFNLAGSFRQGEPIVEQSTTFLMDFPSHPFKMSVINGDNLTDSECVIQSAFTTSYPGSYQPTVNLRIPVSKGHLKKAIRVEFQPKPTNGTFSAFFLSSWAAQPVETNGIPFSVVPADPDLGSSKRFPYAVATHVDSPIVAMANGENGAAFLGGAFTTWEGLPLSGLVKLRPEGEADLTFLPDSPAPFRVTALLWVDGEGLYVAREFLTDSIADAWQLVRLTTDGRRDPTFAPIVANGAINALLRQWSGTVTFAGDFTRLNGVPSARLRRARSDGMLDSSFNVGTGPDGEVKALALVADGSVLLGGSFVNYQGSSSKGLAKVSSDGSRDLSFSVGAGFDGEVRAIAVSFDGRIAVGGSFTNYNSTPQTNLLSFQPDWKIDGKFATNRAPNQAVDQIFTEFDNSFLVAGSFSTLAGLGWTVQGAFVSDALGNPPSSYRQVAQAYWVNFRPYLTVGTRVLSQIDQRRFVYSAAANEANPLSVVGYLGNTHIPPAMVALEKSSDEKAISFAVTSATRDGLTFDLQHNGQTVLTTTNLTGSFGMSAGAAVPHYWRVLVRDGTSVIGASDYLIIPPTATPVEAKWSAPLLLGDGTVKLDLSGDSSGNWIIERSSDLHDWTPVATNATTITLTLGNTNVFVRARR